MQRTTGRWIGIAVLSAMAVGAARGEDDDGLQRVRAAQAFRAAGEPVVAAPDGTLFCEAEEFQVVKPAAGGTGGWQAGYWGQNYYAATFANTFLSRKAFLGAPEQGDETVATINLTVPEAGRYLVLVRYEAAYRFETQFKVRVEQGGKAKLDRLYGARDNIKIWAFGKKLTNEVEWGWGAVENVVWEGHDAYADLQAGPARIVLTAGPQPEPAARRNVDLVMLTRDEAQVKERIAKEGYLPLDGWLTQAGDVWMRVINEGDKAVNVRSLSFYGRSPVHQHSPYWVHMRRWKPVSVTVEAGETGDWVDVGGTMDALNDGQWGFQSGGPCKIEFGVRNAAGRIEPVRTFDCNGQLPLIAYADVRYLRNIQPPAEAYTDLFNHVKAQPAHGRPLEQTAVYAFGALSKDFYDLFSIKLLDGGSLGKFGYRDMRRKLPAQLEEESLKMSEEDRANLLVISLGDEIALPKPGKGDAGFVKYLQSQGVAAAEVVPESGGDWDKIAFTGDPKLQADHPALYYWEQRFRQNFGIHAQKRLTDALRKHLPNAHIGANYSPHHGGGEYTQLGAVYSWVNCFREDGMTLPWGEDYIWQVPVGSPQMNAINLDLFRAGIRGKAGRKIMYYVMPHYPGNTPAMWRRLFHNAVGHGATIFNLFEFNPVWAAYSENHVTSKDMYATVHRTLRELGLYEDIVQAGQVRPARTALWFSETGDIWRNNRPSFGAAKRGLYIAILGQQLPLDFVVDADAADGTLNHYEVLYLTDNNVTLAASQAMAAWVRNGGRLLATAGAGMFDEYNRPNAILRELLGVDQTGFEMPSDAQVSFIKQDLKFVRSLDTVTLDEPASTFPVFGVVSRVKPAADTAVQGRFADGTPAVVARSVGKGRTLYCGFLPSLSYFKPAIPMQPLDRGSTDAAMSHFIPRDFDPNAAALIHSVAAHVLRPVESSVPLIECNIIESKIGTAIVVQNWSGSPAPGVKLTLRIPSPSAGSSLASGAALVAGQDEDGARTFTFDLDVADVLILR